MKKIILTVILVTLISLSITATASAALLGTGSRVMAEGVELIKTSLTGQPINFSDTDFKTALGIFEFKKLTVLSLPSSSEGTLTLSGKAVSAGEVIKRRALSDLTFTPKDTEITESCFTFSVDGTSEESIVCRMRFIDKINYAPKISGTPESTLSVTTQRGISVFGRIDADDPEGDELDYIIVSAPKYGSVSLTDTEIGEFKYTPTKDFSGKDSFTVVVRDEYGNFTKPTTVSLKIIDRMSEVVFSDMTDSKSYNAAVAMAAMGIMNGNIVGDDNFFSPNDGVSRAEFVAMAMKSLSIRPDSTESVTFFDDNSEIPKALVGYIATAARCGIVNGSFEDGELRFRPNDNITHCEAAIIMANLMNISEETSSVSDDIADGVPVFAKGKVLAMYSSGIFSRSDTTDMNATVTREAAAEYLYRISMLEKA